MLKDSEKVGAIVVVGSGIAGIQASLDLANSGMKGYLVENDISVGGIMAQLDKTFPPGYSKCFCHRQAGYGALVRRVPHTSVSRVMWPSSHKVNTKKP